MRSFPDPSDPGTRLEIGFVVSVEDETTRVYVSKYRGDEVASRSVGMGLPAAEKVADALREAVAKAQSRRPQPASSLPAGSAKQQPSIARREGEMNVDKYFHNKGRYPGLTAAEARVLGIPFPLKAGWLIRHGPSKISERQERELKSIVDRRRLRTRSASIKLVSGHVNPLESA